MEEVDTDITDEKQIKPYLFQKGQSGNLAGRPKGSISIMTEIKRHLKENPKRLAELVDYYMEDEKMRALLLQMIDGKPHQSTDMTSAGEKLDLGVVVLPSKKE